MRIHTQVMHKIDLENQITQRIAIDSDQLRDYIKTVIDYILQAQDSRQFGFQSDTTEVRRLISNVQSTIAVDDFLQMSDSIAERLKREEVKTNEQYGHLNEVKKGSLIQSIVEKNGLTNYLIVKVEHQEYLDESNFQKQVGLPYEKLTLKSCLIIWTESGEIDNVILTDTNSKISKYWYSGFLELRELNSDEKNTKTAFSAIEGVLNKKVKKDSPADHTILRNSLIGYFKSQPNFTISGVLESVFGQYEPSNDNIDIGRIKETIMELPTKKGFDTSFNLVPEEVKARAKRTYKVSEEIELKIAYLADIQDKIQAVQDPDGKKYIRILTDNNEVFEAVDF